MIRTEEIAGHDAIWLENEHLGVCVLPDKGADIYQLIHRPSGVQFLMQTPQGLKPPNSKSGDYAAGGGVPDKYIAANILENYEGGWQELFPNPGAPATYNHAALPFHGEAALLPWDYTVVAGRGAEAEVTLRRTLQGVPFRLERTLRLRPDAAVLEVTGRVVNLSDQAQHFAWGHHLMLGGDFLEAGCRMETPAGVIHTPEQPPDAEAVRLASGQAEPWPQARGRQPGERIDLRHIPGPEFRGHDEAFLTGLQRGEATVSNPRQGLSFRLEWDTGVYGCLANWRALGGALQPPLTGIYGLGLSPWTTRYSLTEAIERGEALCLAPKEELSTSLIVSILKA